MPSSGREPHPLPDHLILAQTAAALRDARAWGWVFDEDWRLVYVDELRRMMGGSDGLAVWDYEYMGSAEHVRDMSTWFSGNVTVENMREQVALMCSMMLADLPGGREQLRGRLDPMFHDLVDELVPNDHTVASFTTTVPGVGGPVGTNYVVTRLRDSTGRHVGTVATSKPGAGMTTIASVAHGHLLRARSTTCSDGGSVRDQRRWAGGPTRR